MKVKSEGEVAQLCPTLCNPWTAAYQAPPSMGFSRQEYWSGVPLLSPRILECVAIPFSRDFPNPVIEPGSSALRTDSLPSEPPGS